MKGNYIKLDSQKNLINVTSERPKLNYGLSILKVINSFLVIVAHNFHRSSTKNRYILYITKNRLLHVPSFLIMSFYFMCKHLLSLDFKIFFKRLIRLLIPYILWPIFFWKLNRYLNKNYNKKFPATFEVLKQQLLLANRYIYPLWYHFDLIIFTILFFIIIFIFRKHSLFILHILSIICYYIEYSEYNFNSFFIKNPYYNVTGIKSLHECFPFAVTGYTIGYYKVLDIINKHKIKTFVLSILIYNLIADYFIFKRIKGELYYGANLNIQSICLVFIFSLFPSDIATNNVIRKFLIFITNYTGGIYYLHVPLRMYLKDYSVNIKNGTFLGLIMTYIIIYIICFVGMLIFGKTPLKYLFY